MYICVAGYSCLLCAVFLCSIVVCPSQLSIEISWCGKMFHSSNEKHQGA